MHKLPRYLLVRRERQRKMPYPQYHRIGLCCEGQLVRECADCKGVVELLESEGGDLNGEEYVESYIGDFPAGGGEKGLPVVVAAFVEDGWWVECCEGLFPDYRGCISGRWPYRASCYYQEERWQRQN